MPLIVHGIPRWLINLKARLQSQGQRAATHFDTEFTPCGCTTHRFQGINCVLVLRHLVAHKHEQLECSKCGSVWRNES